MEFLKVPWMPEIYQFCGLVVGVIAFVVSTYRLTLCGMCMCVLVVVHCPQHVKWPWSIHKINTTVTRNVLCQHKWRAS